MTNAVITATFNNYDTLKAFPQQDVECRTICVTDDPKLEAGNGWDHIVHEYHPDLHPNRAAKRPKCCPWEYTDADFVIWIDASLAIRSSSFVRELYAFAHPIAQLLHPDRDCCLDEGIYSQPIGKYRSEPIVEQCEAYAELGMPQHWGLWATGLIARRRSSEVEAFGYAWLADIERWSFQDQVSEPFVLRAFGLRPVPLPGDHMHSPWHDYNGSSRH